MQPRPQPQPIPAPPRQPVPRTRVASKVRKKPRRIFGLSPMVVLGLFGALSASMCAALAVGAFFLLGMGRVVPGVSALGVDLGGMTVDEATMALQAQWGDFTLRDGDRTWTLDPARLGLGLDAAATAQRAADVMMPFVRTEIAPSVALNAAEAERGLREIEGRVALAAIDAGIRLVDGAVQPSPPVNGRVLDIPATLAALQSDPAAALVRGDLTLRMREVAPAVSDASALVAQASPLLASPLRVRAYDPIDDDDVVWQVAPAQWADWLTAREDASSTLGLSLSLDAAQVAAFLQNEARRTLRDGEYIDLDAAAAALSDAVGKLDPNATVRVFHEDRVHTVRSGETITSIAWDYGVPYPYIQQANGGIEDVSIGQQITIPSADTFFDYEPVADKRIVVSISGQWTKVYENGDLLWDWQSSTGIFSSPTWPGVYQIISFEENAYAGNWNLYMPNFMGVYRPIPGSDFTNGFHGFPTRGGGQLLWENSLGTRVTYGCILLSDANVQRLWDWVELGVVVEILP